MSGFPLLDLAAGMIFIYFLFNIICSSASEVRLFHFKEKGRVARNSQPTWQGPGPQQPPAIAVNKK